MDAGSLTPELSAATQILAHFVGEGLSKVAFSFFLLFAMCFPFLLGSFLLSSNYKLAFLNLLLFLLLFLSFFTLVCLGLSLLSLHV